ncbi:PE family protein [Mycobacterium marinum]|uniref:PE family protein n=1 Tax=Mycobacterium marinum TaxID=1781 RepID=UPI001594F263|nr:PE-PPE domain-containing protein [Mycobacterium marinum]
MTFVITQPDILTTAAADIADIRSAIGVANAAAASPTTAMMAAAGDEVSQLIAKLFSAYGQECQAVITDAAVFHDQFAATLAAAGSVYTQAEAAGAATLSQALTTLSSPIRALLGGTAASASGAMAAAAPMAAAGDPIYTLVVGGSGNPIPSPAYISNVVSKFVAPYFPVDPALVQGLFTPAQFYIDTGIKTLPLNVSVPQGVAILTNTLVGTNPPYLGLLTSGNTVNVTGDSQSAMIASLVMRALNPTNSGAAGSPYFDDLTFSLFGNPMNPNGGLFARFPGLSLPSMGLDFFGSTPDNSFPTNVFTLEYDGAADFPRYPINFLADLNAFLGIQSLHGQYPSLTPEQLDTAIPLTNTVGPTSTNYYMIPSPHLPLLDPVRAIPVIGTPIADLIEPDLRYLVNWGYGDPAYGWSTSPPNVPTPFGVLPPLQATTSLPGYLAIGTQQGVNAFVSDINAEISAYSNLPSTLLSAPLGASGAGGTLLAGLSPATFSPNDFIHFLQSANTTIVNDISNTAANTYAFLLPTADIANALVTSVPSYDLNLFLSGIEQAINGDPAGGLVYAFGAPIAANIALGTLAGGFELRAFLGVASQFL